MKKLSIVSASKAVYENSGNPQTYGEKGEGVIASGYAAESALSVLHAFASNGQRFERIRLKQKAKKK